MNDLSDREFTALIKAAQDRGDVEGYSELMDRRARLHKKQNKPPPRARPLLTREQIAALSDEELEARISQLEAAAFAEDGAWPAERSPHRLPTITELEARRAKMVEALIATDQTIAALRAAEA